MKICPICGYKLTKIENKPLYAKGVLSDFLVNISSYSKCERCGEIYLDPKEAEEYERRISEVYEKDK